MSIPEEGRSAEDAAAEEIEERADLPDDGDRDEPAAAEEEEDDDEECGNGRGSSTTESPCETLSLGRTMSSRSSASSVALMGLALEVAMARLASWNRLASASTAACSSSSGSRCAELDEEVESALFRESGGVVEASSASSGCSPRRVRVRRGCCCCCSCCCLLVRLPFPLTAWGCTIGAARNQTGANMVVVV